METVTLLRKNEESIPDFFTMGGSVEWVDDRTSTKRKNHRRIRSAGAVLVR
jgi:hypothetical protein